MNPYLDTCLCHSSVSSDVSELLKVYSSDHLSQANLDTQRMPIVAFAAGQILETTEGRQTNNVVYELFSSIQKPINLRVDDSAENILAANLEKVARDRFDASEFKDNGLDDVVVVGARRDCSWRNGVQDLGEAYILFGTNHSIAEYDLTSLQSETGGDGSDGRLILGRRYFDSTGDMMNVDGIYQGKDKVVAMEHRVSLSTDKLCCMFGFEYQS